MTKTKPTIKGKVTVSPTAIRTCGLLHTEYVNYTSHLNSVFENLGTMNNQTVMVPTRITLSDRNQNDLSVHDNVVIFNDGRWMVVPEILPLRTFYNLKHGDIVQLDTPDAVFELVCSSISNTSMPFHLIIEQIQNMIDKEQSNKGCEFHPITGIDLDESESGDWAFLILYTKETGQYAFHVRGSTSNSGTSLFYGLNALLDETGFVGKDPCESVVWMNYIVQQQTANVHIGIASGKQYQYSIIPNCENNSSALGVIVMMLRTLTDKINRTNGIR